MSVKARIIIVVAGVAGLTLALRLCQGSLWGSLGKIMGKNHHESWVRLPS